MHSRGNCQVIGGTAIKTNFAALSEHSANTYANKLADPRWVQNYQEDYGGTASQNFSG